MSDVEPNPLSIGDQAPDFTLLDQDSEPNRLFDYRKEKVLLYFFLKTSSPGCALQTIEMQTHIDELKRQGVSVVGISTDSPEKLQKFSEAHFLTFSLLSDWDHRVAHDFGAWGKKKFLGKSFYGLHRSSFLVDEQGIIQAMVYSIEPQNHWNWVQEACQRVFDQAS